MTVMKTKELFRIETDNYMQCATSRFILDNKAKKEKEGLLFLLPFTKNILRILSEI